MLSQLTTHFVLVCVSTKNQIYNQQQQQQLIFVWNSNCITIQRFPPQSIKTDYDRTRPTATDRNRPQPTVIDRNRPQLWQSATHFVLLCVSTKNHNQNQKQQQQLIFVGTSNCLTIHRFPPQAIKTDCDRLWPTATDCDRPQLTVINRICVSWPLILYFCVL